jgi:MFS family permease
MWIAYSVVQFPAGIFSDNFGERKILTLSILIGALGIILFSFSSSFNFFMFACIVFGLGSGLFGTPRVTSLSKIYPENDGTVLGFTFSAGNFGSAILPFIAGILATYFGWRFGFIFCIPLFIIAILLLWNSPFKPPSSSTWGRYDLYKNVKLLIEGLSKKDVLLVSSATLLSVFTFQGFTSFFPLFLITMKGTSATMATTIFSVFFITGAISQPISGIISDRYGERRLLLYLAALHSLCLLSLPFIYGTIPLILLSILLGTRAGLAPVNNAYLASSIPSKVQGTGLGFLRSIFIGIGAFASFMVGVIADNYSFDLAFLLLGGLFFIATLCYFFLSPSRE